MGGGEKKWVGVGVWGRGRRGGCMGEGEKRGV